MWHCHRNGNWKGEIQTESKFALEQMPVKTKPLIHGFAKNRFLEISYSISGHCEIIPRHFYGSSLQSLQLQSQTSVKLFVGLRINKYTWKVHL